MVYKQQLSLGKAQTYLTQTTGHWVQIYNISDMNICVQGHGVQRTAKGVLSTEKEHATNQYMYV